MDNHLTFHRLRASLSGRNLGTVALYVLFVCGGLWNAFRGDQPLLKNLTPLVLFAVACAAFLLTYRLTLRSVGAAFAVLIMSFLCAASGVNLGFPFGDYVYTNALGPKLLDVPLVIPFLWLAGPHHELERGRPGASVQACGCGCPCRHGV